MDENDVGQWFRRYLDALTACGRSEDDAPSLLAYCGVPLLFATDDGFTALTPEEHVAAALRQQIDAMRSAEYDHSDVLRSETKVLNATRPCTAGPSHGVVVTGARSGSSPTSRTDSLQRRAKSRRFAARTLKEDDQKEGCVDQPHRVHRNGQVQGALIPLLATAAHVAWLRRRLPEIFSIIRSMFLTTPRRQLMHPRRLA